MLDALAWLAGLTVAAILLTLALRFIRWLSTRI